MKMLFLLVNNTCDMECTYCFYTIGHSERSHFRVRPEIASHVARKIASVGFNMVILSGGDPLCSRFKHESYVLIRELKAHGCKVIINTSAACLDESDLDTIIDLGVDRIDVSIDSHNMDIHDAQRGHYVDAVRTLTGLIKKGYRNVASTIVVTKLNAPTLSETICWLHEIGVEDVHIQRAFLPHRGVEKDDGIMQAIDKAALHLHATHSPLYIDLIKRTFVGGAVPCRAQCRMGKEYFVCDAQGKLIPCFHRDDIVLGNLFNDPVDELLGSLENHELIACDVPPCFGNHCESLFDIPTFWRKSS